MPTPSSHARESSLVEPPTRRPRKNPLVRRRRATRSPAAWTSPSLTRQETEVVATWHGQRGVSELRLRSTRHGLQVRMRTWHPEGDVIEETFTLRSRLQFEAWHATADTKFEFAIAHDEIRRFGHASLAD